MDLSHLELLHKGSLSTGYREDTRATMTTSEEGGNVRVSWVLRDFVTTTHTREVNDVGARTDSYRDSVWIAPCIVRNELVQVPAGTPRNAGRLRFNTHICTPETHRSMHDFALRSRMLALIQERMGDAPFESFDPVMFHIDTGAVRVRRILDRMVSEEQSCSTSQG
jgi:Vanillate O-demethylase oxygenase C-terminal domain